MTPILILAAGASARMRGADKLLEPVDGMPLIRAQAVKALRENAAVFVAVPDAAHARVAALEGLPVTFLVIAQAREGLSATLREAVAALPPCPRFMVLLADLPEIEADDIATVLRAPDEVPDALIWRGATADGKGGHPLLFDASLRQAFATLEGDDGGRAVVKAAGNRVHLVPLPAERARVDLDTPEDWSEWRGRTGR